MDGDIRVGTRISYVGCSEYQETGDDLHSWEKIRLTLNESCNELGETRHHIRLHRSCNMNTAVKKAR